jgi:hypothetical protein
VTFLDRLLTMLRGSAPAAGESSSYWFEVRCDRCGETLRGRIDMRNELSLRDDAEGFFTRKSLVGGDRCFHPVETVHYFSAQRLLTDRTIRGGRFLDDSNELSR